MKYSWEIVLRKDMWWPDGCSKNDKVFWKDKFGDSVFAVLFMKTGALAVLRVIKMKGFADTGRSVRLSVLPPHPENRENKKKKPKCKADFR